MRELRRCSVRPQEAAVNSARRAGCRSSQKSVSSLSVMRRTSYHFPKCSITRHSFKDIDGVLMMNFASASVVVVALW